MREIWVVRVGKRWIVRLDGEEIRVAGDRSAAIDRASSLAQLETPADVIVTGRDGSVEERRRFGVDD
ncbi:MAG: DUF2188 domain-containing protein [Actinomycetota bacterium]